MASHRPTKMPITREEDILALQTILEGKPACRGPGRFADGETITGRRISAALSSVYCGQAAPPATQIVICATVSERERGGKVRPSPGCQPQPTRSSLAT